MSAFPHNESPKVHSYLCAELESNDIVKELNISPEFFLFTNQHNRISKAFEKFHTFEMMEFDLPECSTCKEKNTFVNYDCYCPFCTLYYADMFDASVKEYVLHCYECHRCLCDAQPQYCIGCALIYALMNENYEIIQTYHLNNQ